MLSLGGRTIGQLCNLARITQECEDAASKFICPDLQPTRYPVIGVLEKIEQAIGKHHGSTTYLKPIRVMNEIPEKFRSESPESLLARTVDKEKTASEVGIKAESIYGRYVKMKNEGNLCDLDLGDS
jgi:hypothetical protein